MIRRPPRSPLERSSAASDVYKRQERSPLEIAADVELIIFRLSPVVEGEHEALLVLLDDRGAESGSPSAMQAELDGHARFIAEQRLVRAVEMMESGAQPILRREIEQPSAKIGVVDAGAIEVLVSAHAPASRELVTEDELRVCLLYTSPSPRDRTRSRMPSSA